MHPEEKGADLEAAPSKDVQSETYTLSQNNYSKIDLTMVGTFLSKFCEDSLVTFLTFDDSITKRPELIRVLHGKFDDHVGELTNLNKKGACVCFTVNATDGRGRKTENITKVRAFFLDLDGASLEPVLQFPLEPHFIIESSKMKFHVYWLVEGLPLDQFQTLQKRIAERFNGDKSCTDLPRAMRLPGFLHQKDPTQPFLSRVIYDSCGQPYPAEKIRETFPLNHPDEDSDTQNDGQKKSELDDPILTALRAKGLVKSPIVNRPGAWNITCPWVSEHTEEIDGGTVYFTRGNKYKTPAFKCLHAHCASRTLNDLKSFLGLKELPANSFILEPGKTHIAARKGIEILSPPKHGIFQRSGQLVRLVQYRRSKIENSTITRPEGAFQIIEVDTTYLIEQLGTLTTWERYDSRSESNRPVDYPTLAARMILNDCGQSFSFLRGFINSPTIRLDGSLLSKPGYDETTGLFLNPLGTVFPEVSDQPSRTDATEALSILKDVIKDFPFADEVSESVALSEMITALVRRVLPVAPIFANDASTASSGKTLLARLPSYIATGKGCTLISPTRNEEEMRKRLAAGLMRGDLVFCLDNVDFPFESRDFCIIATSEVWSERVLGESRNAEIETNSLVIITGNNLALIGDLCTRVLKCRLVPLIDHPENRKFDRDLNRWIPSNRGIIVAAVLTIIRAYITAGCPDQNLSGFREYVDWCRLVRDPLVWLGCANPCDSISQVQALDPKRAEMEALFSAMDAFPSDSFTVQQLVNIASNHMRREEDDTIQALYDILSQSASKRDGTICSIKLGHLLRSYKDRICNNKQLKECGKDRTNKTIWKIVTA